MQLIFLSISPRPWLDILHVLPNRRDQELPGEFFFVYLNTTGEYESNPSVLSITIILIITIMIIATTLMTMIIIMIM